MAKSRKAFIVSVMLLPALLLAGCSDRDTTLSEHVAAAQAAADRAERAQEAAEKAAKTAGAAPAQFDESGDETQQEPGSEEAAYEGDDTPADNIINSAPVPQAATQSTIPGAPGA
jgi:hypothetical protein